MDEHYLENGIASLAATVADKTRSRMLCALMDGRAYTATELSAVAEVSTSTTSSHLSRLLDQHLITCVKQGRYRYFKIANPEVAKALETLMGLAGRNQSKIRSNTPANLRFARTCYDHLAGEVAVCLHNKFIELGYLNADSYTLSSGGRQALEEIGVELKVKASKRAFACGCLDWSERQMHLGGQLGQMLLEYFIKLGWFEKQLSSRELRLTVNGRNALLKHFGLAFE
ncbi:helix-turn-helix transcriptional regulator [Chitinibacter tainanensis]|uniref:ArsR/SmtB family transcription factor n=1 Tax=Chitinibacter tainanensis TaxID=230667 RepID=UPI002357D321|nr:helix-turn-helix transcriptional regulator [Chitinibacter tainanensis]